MKKLFILLFISMTIFTIVNGQFTKFGGGPGLTSGFPFPNNTPNIEDYDKSGHFYASVKGIIELSLPVHFSPSFTFFVPHISKLGNSFSSSTFSISTMMFDFNGHYVVNSLDRFEFYGLAGIDIMFAWKKEVYKTTGTSSFSETTKFHDNALGLNIGAGSYMKITEQIDLYAEAKYILYGKGKLFFSNYNQVMFNAGVLINLEWLWKNEKPGI
jgi:opacity protein-like surface antigen